MAPTDEASVPGTREKKTPEGLSLEDKLLREQTLVNERRFAPGEQAPSARMRTPSERDRDRAKASESPEEPEVPPLETPEVERVAKQSAPRKPGEPEREQS